MLVDAGIGYVARVGRVVDGCRGANSWLARQFDAAVEALTARAG
jgi:hypothetical protein